MCQRVPPSHFLSTEEDCTRCLSSFVRAYPLSRLCIQSYEKKNEKPGPNHRALYFSGLQMCPGGKPAHADAKQDVLLPSFGASL